MDFISVSYLNNKQSERLDAYLSEVYPILGRRHWKKACEQGLVTLNNRSVKSGTSLKHQDLIAFHIKLLPQDPAQCELEGLARVVFEDECILVLEKTFSVHSVMQKLNTSPTLAHWIADYCASCKTASPDPTESGLLGRLDFFTSGLLVAAKDRTTWERLSKAQKKDRFQKGYVALCEGRLSRTHFEINQPLKQSRSGKKMEVCTSLGEGVAAKTRVVAAQTISRQASLVQLRGSSFRRHQLRLHMSHLGNPLVGDSLYGSKRELQDFLPREGFFLHSSLLSFPHPASKELITFESHPNELDILKKL